MDNRTMRDVVIYDGECAFCRSQIKIIKTLDICGKLNFESCHDEAVRKKYNHISYEDFLSRMYVVDVVGNSYGGAEAVRYISKKLVVLWPLAILLHIPYSNSFWHWLYDTIARNRYRIAGKCMDGCSIK